MLFSILAMIFYLSSLIFILPGLFKKRAHYHGGALFFALGALVCHLGTFLPHLYTTTRPSFLTLVSLTSLIISSMMTFSVWRNRGWFLLPFIYTLSIICLIFTGLLPQDIANRLDNLSSPLLLHIGIALFAYSTLTITTFYSLQFAWMNHQFKHKKWVATDMPPLMTIERKLFHLMEVGVFLLTLTIMSGWYYWRYSETISIHKPVFSSLAWIIYLSLLWGHRTHGWRGVPILIAGVIASLFLTLAYFAE